MIITIDGQEYHTAEEYIAVGAKALRKQGLLPAPDCLAEQGPGGKWHISLKGMGLYLPDRADMVDIMSSPAVLAYVEEEKRKDCECETLMNRRGSQKSSVNGLIVARDHFASIGTRRAKLRLNKLIKTSEYARALRIALEIEDKNLTAKRYHGGDIGGYTYDQINYFGKAEGIEELIQIATAQGWIFGIQPSDAGSTTHVIYFDIPGAGQVSWHYTPQDPNALPKYPGTWDQQANSTLRKLEGAIRPLVA